MNRQMINGSVLAYKDIYPQIAEAIEHGEEVTVYVVYGSKFTYTES